MTCHWSIYIKYTVHSGEKKMFHSDINQKKAEEVGKILKVDKYSTREKLNMTK